MKLRSTTVALGIALACSGAALAQSSVTMNLVDAEGTGESIGTVSIAESEHGIVLTPKLQGLTPGLHGFHVHENPSCEAQAKDGKRQAAAAAGGHYDPGKSGRHGTPWGEGHLGDLPALYVDSMGKASQPVLAPRLKMADVQGRALMIHEGGDNFADQPAPLGGGGGRIACGLIR